MKCPHCGKSVVAPHARVVNVAAAYRGVDVIILYCPSCEAILGAVNKPKD